MGVGFDFDVAAGAEGGTAGLFVVEEVVCGGGALDKDVELEGIWDVDVVVFF